LFFTWLYRIAVNTAISMKRKQRQVLRIQPGMGGKTAIEPLDPSESHRPGFALELADEERKVHDILAKLSTGPPAVVIMKEMEGMRYGETGVVLGGAVGTIRSRLHRPRLEIRELFLQLQKPDAE